MLSNYLTDEMIVKKLIKQRCKLADKRFKQMQVVEFVSGTKVKELDEEKTELYALFPPRSKWCRIGYERRKKMDSVQRNAFMLYATYNKAKQKMSKDAWFVKLQAKIAHIRYLALHPSITIPKPTVQMLFKKSDGKDKVVCRPVCKFDMDIKIVLSLYNKFLTFVLDDEFLSYSFAFRKPQKGICFSI
jgi:hypothetical protein